MFVLVRNTLDNPSTSSLAGFCCLQTQLYCEILGKGVRRTSIRVIKSPYSRSQIVPPVMISTLEAELRHFTPTLQQEKMNIAMKTCVEKKQWTLAGSHWSWRQIAGSHWSWRHQTSLLFFNAVFFNAARSRAGSTHGRRPCKTYKAFPFPHKWIS